MRRRPHVPEILLLPLLTLTLRMGLFFYYMESVQFNSVAQFCPTLCNPMDCSTPDFLVHHQLLELAQTRVLPIGDVMPQSFLSSRVEVSGLLNSSVALNNFWLFYSFFLFSCSLTFPFLQSSRVLHFFQSIC